MKSYIHTCKGTCSRSIEIIYDENNHIINDINVVGGCPGNLKGIKALVKGRTLEEVHDTLKGITCGTKPTSCPDQLATGIEEILTNC